MLRAIPCTVMRGGTSKGLYFDARVLPEDTRTRDRVLLAAMGSPDRRQIDGMGGAHPLTSKVAVIGPPSRPDADVDYLFLQVGVGEASVSDAQNCGNILAGVGPWAVEHGYVAPGSPTTTVRIHMLNTRTLAVAQIATPDGVVDYEGEARIDGVPGSAAPVAIEFLDVAGSSCGALYPTGAVVDRIDGVDVTCIDHGMPVVIVAAADLGRSGAETPEELEADSVLCARVERIRREAGIRMNLGDVAKQTVPKVTLIGPPVSGGTVSTRSFIPKRVHEAIGVLGAVSVATAVVTPGSVAARVAIPPGGAVTIEHPTGSFTVDVSLAARSGGVPVAGRSTLLRTARLLMRGEVYVPKAAWSPT